MTTNCRIFSQNPDKSYYVENAKISQYEKIYKKLISLTKQKKLNWQLKCKEIIYNEKNRYTYNYEAALKGVVFRTFECIHTKQYGVALVTDNGAIHFPSDLHKYNLIYFIEDQKRPKTYDALLKELGEFSVKLGIISKTDDQKTQCSESNLESLKVGELSKMLTKLHNAPEIESVASVFESALNKKIT
jgi:hypothetical protein